MSKFSFWQFMAMWSFVEQEKEKKALKQHTTPISRKQKHKRSLEQHKYIYFSKRSR